MDFVSLYYSFHTLALIVAVANTYLTKTQNVGIEEILVVTAINTTP
jgi:hypothetical protein